MRILEQCIQAWPMPDLQAQVQSLREAFSANINKPFELKPTFPYGSPAARLATSPVSDANYGDSQLIAPMPHELKPTISFNQGSPMTPPISGLDGQNMLQHGQQPQPMTSPPLLGDDALAQWNPSRLFEYGKEPLKIDTSVTLKSNAANGHKSQWNAAFGTPASTISSGHLHNQGSPPPAMYSPAASTAGSGGDMAGDLPGHSPQPQAYSVSNSMSSAAQMQAASASFATQSTPQFISPSMWQDTVASTYIPNDLKRRWDAVSGNGWSDSDPHQVARPRLRFGPINT